MTKVTNTTQTVMSDARQRVLDKIGQNGKNRIWRHLIRCQESELIETIAEFEEFFDRLYWAEYSKVLQACNWTYDEAEAALKQNRKDLGVEDVD